MVKHFDIEKFKKYLITEIEYYNKEIKNGDEKTKLYKTQPTFGFDEYSKRIIQVNYEVIDNLINEKISYEKILDEVNKDEYYYECNCK